MTHYLRNLPHVPQITNLTFDPERYEARKALVATREAERQLQAVHEAWVLARWADDGGMNFRGSEQS
jgi:hypothetical protein